MEYPPRLHIQENGDWVWDSETGEDGVERAPDQEYQMDGHGLVHFDLDPKNGEYLVCPMRIVIDSWCRPPVMIGDNDEKHPAVPVFKVIDRPA